MVDRRPPRAHPLVTSKSPPKLRIPLSDHFVVTSGGGILNVEDSEIKKAKGIFPWLRRWTKPAFAPFSPKSKISSHFRRRHLPKSKKLQTIFVPSSMAKFPDFHRLSRKFSSHFRHRYVPNSKQLQSVRAARRWLNFRIFAGAASHRAHSCRRRVPVVQRNIPFSPRDSPNIPMVNGHSFDSCACQPAPEKSRNFTS